MTTPSPDGAPAAGLVAGPPDALCLDFANTRYWRGTPAPTEELATPGALLRWCEAAAGLASEEAVALRAHWDAAPQEADARLASALALREAVFRIFAAGAAGAPPMPEDVSVLNAALAAAPPRRRLRCDAAASVAEGGWAWEIPAMAPGADTTEALLARVLWSAGDLLTGARRARVRQCANPHCLWLFLDDSKSGSRRWCSMASCGNRAKAHRHYARRRQAVPEAG